VRLGDSQKKDQRPSSREVFVTRFPLITSKCAEAMRKIAKTLGLTIRQSLLVAADELIE
jgi:hypothetical protein